MIRIIFFVIIIFLLVVAFLFFPATLRYGTLLYGLREGIITALFNLSGLLLGIGFGALLYILCILGKKILSPFLAKLRRPRMIREPIKASLSLALGIVSVALLLAGYTYMSHKQHLKNPDDRTIPTWSQLRHGVKTIFKVDTRSHQRWIVVDSKATGMRLFLGLLYGVLGSIALGLLMGCFSAIEAFFVPPLSFLAKCPPTAMLAVFFVLVGTGENMFITMIAFGVLPTLAQSIYLAAKKDVPEELLHKAYTLGASNTEAILCIVYNNILPKMIDAIRLCIGPAVVYLIAAEMLCANTGFGYRMRLQSRLLNMDVVYPYIAILAGFGFAMDNLLRYIQRVCCPWYIRERG